MTKKRKKISPEPSPPKNEAQYIKLLKKGIAYHRNSDFINAIKHLNKAMEYDTKNSQLFMLLADSLFKIDNKQAALQVMSHALEANPDDPANVLVLGNAAYNMQFFDLAAKIHAHHIRLSPNDPIGYNNYATALREDGKLNEAISILQDVLPLFPQSVELWNTLGSIVAFRDGKEKAIIFFEESLKLNPENAQALNNIAPAYYSVGNYKKAEEMIRKAIKVQPTMKDPHLYLATLLLSTRQFKEGWEEYQWRHDAKIKLTIRYNQLPYWQGEPLKGKKIFVFCEQGIGDEILFTWHFNELIKEADKVGIACAERLVPLFRSSFPDAQVEKTLTKLNKQSDDIFRAFPDFNLEEFDYQCAACDVTKYKWQRYEDIKDNIIPTLKPDQKIVKHWKKELDKLPHKISIGVAWRSGITLANRSRNYTELLNWKPLLEHPNVNYVNVQYGDCDAELAELEEKTGIKIHNFKDLDLRDDFEATTAMMSSLDLVIGPSSAPTMQSQMAGVETWFIISGMHWWSFGEDKPKWNPKSRILEKNDNDPWSGHMANCASELGKWLKAKRK